MASLYEIDAGILACIDPETGEIVDFERLESLQMERETKIESVVLWLKNLQADAIAYKAEKEAFAAREAQAMKKAEQLKKWLLEALQGGKFSTAKCAVSFRRSVQVDIFDADKIPPDCLRETVTIQPDKAAIKARLKDGQEVSGCRLIEALNPQIK